jgi:AraC-like DNA-binding protein
LKNNHPKSEPAAFTKVAKNSKWPTPSLRPEASGPAAFSHQYARAREADPWADYAGGIVPVPARDQVRDRWRASGLTQDQVAQRAGISRPQFSNAMQGTYGLSPAAAARLRAVVASLPVVQAALW